MAVTHIIVTFVLGFSSVLASEHNATQCHNTTFLRISCKDGTVIQISGITLYASTTSVPLLKVHCPVSEYDCAIELTDQHPYHGRAKDECDRRLTCDTLRADVEKLSCPGQTNVLDVSYISVLYSCVTGIPDSTSRSPSSSTSYLPPPVPTPSTSNATSQLPISLTSSLSSPVPTASTSSGLPSPSPIPTPSPSSTTPTPQQPQHSTFTSISATADEESKTTSVVDVSTADSTDTSEQSVNPGESNNQDSFPIEVAIAVPVLIVCLTTLIIVVVCLVRRKRRKHSSPSSEVGDQMEITSTARANLARGVSNNGYSPLSDNVQFNMFDEDKARGDATSDKNGMAITPTDSNTVFEQVPTSNSNLVYNDNDRKPDVLNTDEDKHAHRLSNHDDFNPYCEIGSSLPTRPNAVRDNDFKGEKSSTQDDKHESNGKPRDNSLTEEGGDMAVYSEVNKPREQKSVQDETENENSDQGRGQGGDNGDEKGEDDDEIPPAVPSKSGLEDVTEDGERRISKQRPCLR